MKFKTKIVLALNKSYWYRKLAYHYQKWSVSRNPMNEIVRNYEPRFHKLPNLNNPRNLVEKIYWMQMHCDTSSWTLCADKYRMRNYVQERGCGQYLPKLYGMWEDPNMIEWDKLPKQFVIKANNGCGTVLVVKDKTQYDFRKIKRVLRHWLAIPYGYRGYQPHYLAIKPCIIAEELLSQDDVLNKLSPKSIVDFKVWCFNGQVESILVTYNRTSEGLSLDLYDQKWNRLTKCIQNQGHYYVYPEVEFPCPQCLEEMKKVASALSHGHPQMRVDFYIINGKPILGELTLATGYGYFTDEYYDYLGSLTDLSMMKVVDGTRLPLGV